MKIVTWNVNSLKARREFVEGWLDANMPDVLCLQELKLDTDAVPVEMFEERGYHVAMHAQKQWNGVLIASRTPLEEVHQGLPQDEGQARLVAATTAGLRIVNLYCPQGQSVSSPKFKYKLRFYAGLRRWIRKNHSPEDPLVVLGDLNIAPTADDVWDEFRMDGIPSFHPKEHVEWRKLEQWGLTDAVKPHVPAGAYSFWDYRGGAFRMNQGMRIDHILVTAPLLPRVQDAWIDRDARKKRDGLTASDHAPVGVELEG